MGLKTLIDDEKLRTELGQAARKEVIAKYTWQEHTHRIIEKLKECCRLRLTHFLKKVMATPPTRLPKVLYRATHRLLKEYRLRSDAMKHRGEIADADFFRAISFQTWRENPQRLPGCRWNFSSRPATRRLPFLSANLIACCHT